MTQRSVRRATAVTAILALIAPTTLPVSAQAQIYTGTFERGDGAVTPEACAELGFTVRPQGYERMQYAAPAAPSGRTAGMAGPPPPIPAPPPPPPAPPPPVMVPPPSVIMSAPSAGAVDQIVVSGNRSTSPSLRIREPVPGDTERYPDATPNPVKRVAEEPVSTFSIDVDTASYSNVRRFLEEGRNPPPDAVRVEEMINYFDYAYARPGSRGEPFAIDTAVTDSPWADGRQIVRIGLQGYELPEGERMPLNLTFMVDVSGSMQSPDKLGLAQQTMNLIIDQLRPEDRVAVTFYASDVGTAVGPTPGTQKLRLRCAVASLNAGGSTAGAQGMVNAYAQAEAAFGRNKVNRILMFTDGDFNVGVTDDQRLEDYVARKRDTGIYLSVYGFGRGNYQDARMQTIAQAGNGTAAYVDDLDEARRLFGPMFNRGAFPIADDVKIQVEFNPARVSEYRLIGYETRLLNEEDFNNDQVDAGEVGSGASVTALYEITPVGGPSQIPERRYDGNRPATPPPPPGATGELGFVQVRFKPPGGDTSRLIQQAIPVQSSRPDENTRWALAVAAFGQSLREDPWMQRGYGLNQIVSLAQSARGDDPYGDRAEFIRLVRMRAGQQGNDRP